ncbi:MAG: TetR/AcrR family transcriptional regulator [Bacteroidales bacterium]|nr:TetR/AcrR family transcriptional regulator [Bacteroidales bacterium]
MVTEKIDISETELKIIEAANKVFLQYGIENATMGQIADEAGISRTSLNYYFRDKRNLLQKVLTNVETMIIPTISRYLAADEMTLVTKIESFIDDYLDLVTKYPMVPSFILSELTRDPDWVIQVIKMRNLNFGMLSAQIADEVAMGKVRPFNLEDLFVNVLGLCVIPVLSRPLLLEFLFEHNEEKLNQFMVSRKIEVKRIIRNWVKPE